MERGDALVIAEVKSGATLSASMFNALARLRALFEGSPEHRPIEPVVVYGGQELQRRSAGLALPWDAVEAIASGSP